nr:MAG TPA: hypothetical protein [Caudoviricetes sp.]
MPFTAKGLLATSISQYIRCLKTKQTIWLSPPLT